MTLSPLEVVIAVADSRWSNQTTGTRLVTRTRPYLLPQAQAELPSLH